MNNKENDAGQIDSGIVLFYNFSKMCNTSAVNGVYMGESLRKEMKALDDGKIVELYLMRDESAISRTEEKYGARLRSVAYGILNSRETAEECENDTYMQAWRSIPPNEPRSFLYAFLARIIRNISLNLCRDRDRLKRRAFLCELSAEMEECIPSPDDTECKVDDIILREALNGFLLTLDEEKRNIFVRRYWYIDSISDISERFAISESKVKTTLFRIRKKLREYLEKRGYTL